MTQTQQNRLTMNRTLLDLLLANFITWQASAPFSRAYNQLLPSVTNREAAAKKQATSTTGITDDNEGHAAVAVARVLKMAANVRAYALEKGNHDLFTKLNFTTSFLLHISETRQHAALQSIIETMTAELPNLGEFPEVTSAALTQAQAAVDIAHTSLTAPRTAINSRSVATDSIPGQELIARQAIAVMDNLVGNYTDTASDFVSQYWKARVIVDSGIGHDKPTDDGKDKSTDENKGGDTDSTPPPKA